MLKQEQNAQLWDLIKDIKIAMMVTNDGGKMRARPMHMVQDDFEGLIWFFTDVNSEKVDEVILDEGVCLAYSAPDDDSFVSITGTASINKDQALIDRFWNPFVAAWFPEGKDSGSVGLIEVKVDEAEIWDAKKNKMVQLYEIAKANVKNQEPDLGENKKFG